MTHVYDPDSVVLHKSARAAEKGNTGLCRVVYHVISDNGGTAADGGTISVFTEARCTRRAEFIVLNDDAIAKAIAALKNVETAPSPGIIRAHIFNQLVLICTAHQYAWIPCDGWTSCPISIDLRTKAMKGVDSRRKNSILTWMLRSITPLQLSQVPLTAVV